MPVGALQPDGMRPGRFTQVTSASITALTVGFAAAAAAAVLGEVVAGRARSIRAPRFDSPFAFSDHRRVVDAEFGSIPPYDPALESRTWIGWNYYSAADRDLLIAWYRAQRGGTKPSLIIPDSTINEALLVQLLPPTFVQAGPDQWRVDLRFEEYPRSRW